MAPTEAGRAPAHLVFRSRAVRVAGTVDLVVGAIALLAGIGVAALDDGRSALPIGVAICVVGLVLLLSGLSRLTARMEITPTDLRWTWSFSTETLALDDLVDAALVEKGTPAAGAEWSGFLGGGFVGVAAWWLFDLWSAVTSGEPSLGSVELIVVKRYGGPVAVKPIGAWSTDASHSDATQALHCLQTAIASTGHQVPAALPILRTDAWEQQ